MGGGDREWRRSVLGGRHRRRDVWRVLRDEDFQAACEQAGAGARRRTLPRFRTCSESREGRTQRARRHLARQRPGCCSRARVGTAMARQRRISRPRVLHGREIDLLGRMVPTPDCGRSPGLARIDGSVSQCELHESRKRDRRRTRHRFHLRRFVQCALESSRGCCRLGAERRIRRRYERPPTRAACRAGQRAGFGPLQLRQVQQHAAPRRSNSRRCRRLRRERREPPALSGTHRARNQTAHGEWQGAHHRSRCERAAQVPSAEPVLRRHSCRERHRIDTARAAFVSDVSDGTQSDGARAQRLYGAG